MGMRILGIDPGYAIVGYGALEYTNNQFRTIEYGVITTPKEMSFDRRLEVIYDGVCAIIERDRPEAMAVERLYFTNNQKTAIDVGQARGVILLAARKHSLPIYEYTPLQVKQSIVGYGKAVKKQVMEMTRVMLHLREIPRPDDAADALAIAICHGHSAGNTLDALVARSLGSQW